MSSLKEKDRLYVTLNHRFDQPGYHWAILLAPKDTKENSHSEERNSTRWDITNEGTPHVWRFRRAQVSQYRSISLCARILLAKFNANERSATITRINDILEPLPIKLNDPAFTCRVWVLNGIQTLQDQGLVKLKVSSEAFEIRVKEFGDECVRKIYSREVDIPTEGVPGIPVLDLRK